MGDLLIMGDFSITERGKHTNQQTDTQTHQYHESAWPRGWVKSKLQKYKTLKMQKYKWHIFRRKKV